MVNLYINALLKKRVAITTSSLESLQRAPVLWQTFSPSSQHYRRYCRLIDWRNDALVHPLYWHVRALPLQLKLLSHPKSPFTLLGLVHLHNEVTKYASVRVDIPCEMVARFKQVYQHRKGLAVAVQVTASQRGKRVYDATGTYLMRYADKLQNLPAYEGSGHLPAEYDDQATLSFSAGDVRRYAWVSGDFNPIHLSSVLARLFGFKRAIAHGMFTSARAIATLDAQQPLKGEALSVAFKRPMYLPATSQLKAGDDGAHQCFVLQSPRQAEHKESFVEGIIYRK